MSMIRLVLRNIGLRQSVENRQPRVSYEKVMMTKMDLLTLENLSKANFTRNQVNFKYAALIEKTVATV